MLIFCYHRLYSSAAGSPLVPSRKNFYSVAAEDFRQHLAFLSRHRFRTLLIDEFLDSPSLADSKDVMITFDDGNESDLTLALPLLQEFGFRAVFFICIEYVGQPGYLSWEQVKSLLAAGMSVQSHGLLHHDLTKVPTVELIDELTAARICLERNLDRDIRYLAIPGGLMDGRVCFAAQQAGYDVVCSSVPGVAHPGQRLPRIAIRHSTTQMNFEAMVLGSSWNIFRKHLVYRGAACLKRVVGIEGYEALKMRLWS